MICDGIELAWNGGADYNYNGFRNKFNQLKTVAPEVTITLKGTYDKNTGAGSVTANVKNIAATAISGAKCHFAICQKDTAFKWQTADSLHHIERKMLPNYNGTSVSINANDSTDVTQSFTVQSAWQRNNCSVVVFVQKSNKQIAQAIECDLLKLTGTGINNNQSLARDRRAPFSITKNPDNTSILIRTDIKEAGLKIIDSKGCIIRSATISAQNNRVSIAGLSSGVYFCVLGNDYTIKTKFIKY